MQKKSRSRVFSLRKKARTGHPERLRALTDLAGPIKALESKLKSELANTTKQIEAFLSVQHYLQTGELIGEMHGWPISPDLALYMIELLESNDYDLVIEFGSGTSTVLIARSLEKMAGNRENKNPVRQIAFEHLEKYYRMTLGRLQNAGLIDKVELKYSPLKPIKTESGSCYWYYDCHNELASIACDMPDSNFKILVLVDGPPATIGKYARYPAFPVICHHFSSANVDFLLDDYQREDERQIVELWRKNMENNGKNLKVIESALEKGACFISISSHQKIDVEGGS